MFLDFPSPNLWPNTGVQKMSKFIFADNMVALMILNFRTVWENSVNPDLTAFIATL